MEFKLSINEYRTLFDLLSSFNGQANIKLIALKMMEKISALVNSGLTLNDKNEPVLPESIEVTFEKNELEAFWKGLVSYISNTEVTVDKIAIVKALSKVMKVSNRFAKLEQDIKIQEDEIPLDD